MRSTLRPILRPASLLTATACGVAITSTLLPIRKERSMSWSQPLQQHKSWPSTAYEPRYASWPYLESDFARQDPSSDADFYSSPRFVTHIDDAAISTLREYYATALPRKGTILDICTSWISHYPKDVEAAVSRGDIKVIGMGMNRAELDANKVLNHGRVLADLNQKPDLVLALKDAGVETPTAEKEQLDASTMVVSIDYLTKPVEVLKSLREVTRDGGRVHLVIFIRVSAPEQCMQNPKFSS
ncbi:hypothetical protein TruAng_007520 [Truncatella angustata]|nr:hypothetical protein TruAng_007520 [Truncatella angustata]